MTTLNCPVCHTHLIENTFPGKLIGANGKTADVTIDECPSCQGMWFDEAEIEQTMGAHTPLAVLASGPGELGQRECVHGHGPMKVVQVLGVEIDTCPQCSGIWLDGGELKEVFKSYQSTYETDDGITCAGCGKSGFAESDLNHAAKGLICEQCFAKDEEWGAWSREQERTHHETPHHRSSSSDFRLEINGIDVTGIFGFLKGLFNK